MSASTFLFNQMFSQPYMINQTYHQMQYGQVFGQYQNQNKQTQIQEVEPKNINTNYKEEVIEWFKQFHQPKVQISFTHAGIVTFIIKMYHHDNLDQPSKYSLFEKSLNLSRFPSINQELERKCFKYPIKEEEKETNSYKSQQKLLASIQIFDNDQMFDSMMIEDSIENIINLCENSTDGNAFQSQPKVSYNHQLKQYQTSDSLWFVPATQQTCAYWVINELEKAVALILFQQKLCYKNIKPSELTKTPDQQKSKQQQQLIQLTDFWNNTDKGLKTSIMNKAFNFQKQLKQSFKKQGPYSFYRQKKCQDKDQIWINSFNLETKWILSLLQYENKVENSLFSDFYSNEQFQSSVIEKSIYVTLDQTMQSQTYALKNILQEIYQLNKEKIINDLIKNELQIKQKPKNKKKNKPKKKIEQLEPKNLNIPVIKDNPQKKSPQLFIEGSDILSSCSCIIFFEQKESQEKTREIIFTPTNSAATDKSGNSLHNFTRFSYNDSQQDTHDEQIQVPEEPTQSRFRKQKPKNNKKFFQEVKSDDEISQQSCEQFKQTKEKIQKKTAIQREISPLSEKKPSTKQKLQKVIISDKIPIQNFDQVGSDEFDEDVLKQSQLTMEDRIGKDLIQFTQNLLCECDKLMVFRKLIFTRLQFVVKNIFKDYDADIRLYGSCATGMALPDSDIDLSVIGLEMIPANQLYLPIQMLQEVLNESHWVQNLIPILNSHIPVLKFEVNPFISMDSNSKKMPNYYQDIIQRQDLSYFNIHGPQPSDKLNFKIDITINQYIQDQQDFTQNQDNNLGQISTELVIQWSNNYKELQNLVLFFKMLLKRRGLNQQYKGGLSSFCTVLMMVAFLEYQYQQDPQVGLGQMFILMLDFYGNKFDPQKQGISYQGFGVNPFFPQNFEHPIPVQIFSPLSNKIISSSCAFIQIVLQDMNCMHAAAKEETMKIYQRLIKKKRIRKPCKNPNFIMVELEKIIPLFGTCLQLLH